MKRCLKVSTSLLSLYAPCVDNVYSELILPEFQTCNRSFLT